MARREIVVLSCDRCPIEVDVSSVKFGFEGAAYEMDLCTDHRAEFTDLMGPFVANGRKESRAAKSSEGGGSVKKMSAAQERELNTAKRAWARENGYVVRAAGRFPAMLEVAYDNGVAAIDNRDCPGKYKATGVAVEVPAQPVKKAAVKKKVAA